MRSTTMNWSETWMQAVGGEDSPSDCAKGRRLAGFPVSHMCETRWAAPDGVPAHERCGLYRCPAAVVTASTAASARRA